MMTNAIHLSGAQCRQLFMRCCQQITDKDADQAANQLMRQAARLQRAILCVYVGQYAVNLRQRGDHIEPEQAGTQRIIKIMRQIGNIIGQIGKLGFGRGVMRQLQINHSIKRGSG